MQNEILKTPIDDMIEFIKNSKDCTTKQIGLHFKLPLTVIEKWIVVLEEFNVIKVKYRGFESYIELVEDKKKREEARGITNELLDIDNLRKKFIQKAKAKNIPDYQMSILWPKYIQLHEIELKEVFYNEGKKMNYKPSLVDAAWAKYKIELLNFDK